MINNVCVLFACFYSRFRPVFVAILLLYTQERLYYQLMRLGFRVELVQVDHINYCMIEMCGHDVFRCKLSNLKFNTHCDRDPVCQRAVEAIVEASEKFKQSRSHLQLWALLDDQIFMRGPYAPKDYWPTDIEVKPYVPLQQCLDCCNILVKKKKENVTK